MATLIVEISGLSDETLRRIDAKAAKNGRDRDDYLRDLIERDIYACEPDSKEAIIEAFAPVQEEFKRSGMTETDLNTLIEQARSVAQSDGRKRKCRI